MSKHVFFMIFEQEIKFLHFQNFGFASVIVHSIVQYHENGKDHTPINQY